MKITNPITLDVARSNSYICLLAKQFDSNSRYLEITLADNGQPLTIPADASVVLRATRADGTGAVVSGTVANGKATVEIDDYILEVNGAVTLSLEISKDGETLTTPSCNLTVQKADANGWIRVYIADSSKAAGNYYITIGGVSYSFTTSQAIPAGGSVYFSSNNATAETRNATGAVIETGLVLTEGTTGTQLVTDVPTMSFLATIAGRLAALESEMPNKADKDGIIALANNLTPYSADSGVTQSVPFINQGTGCGNGESIVDTGSYCQLKKKLGNTVCVNQIIQNGNFAATTGWSAQYGTLAVSGNKGTYTRTEVNASARLQQTVAIPARRKLWITVTVTPSAATKLRLTTNAGETLIDSYDVAAGEKVTKTVIATLQNATNTLYFYNDRAAAGAIGDTVIYENAYVIDLSLWYGSNDNIPAHLLSHPEDFGRYYSGSLAANPGQLVNADGSVLKSIGRNCWNGQYTANTRLADYTTGATEASAGYNLTDYIPISPNTAYYHLITASIRSLFYDADKNVIPQTSWTMDSNESSFTAPSNAYFVRFSITNANISGFTISRYYAGESGYSESYPYSVLAEVDTGSEVLRSAGSAADEKAPDETITRNILDLDLGDFNWARYSGYANLFYVNTTTLKGAPSNSSISNVRCAKYVACPAQVIGGSGYTDGYVAVDSNGRIYINDPNYTNQNTFKTAMSGVHLYAEAATPTTEQGTPFSGASADNFAIDDFGSMYWTQTNGVPQGVEIFYPYDYKAAVDTILNEVNGDVTQLVTAEKVPDAPSSNGTYVLKVTVSDDTPTYSWVAE